MRYQKEVDEALAAAEFARNVRKFHARRTQRGSKQREIDLNIAIKRLKTAMKVLRPIIGRLAQGPQSLVADENRLALREASAQVQAERRKLWKMQRKR